MSPRYFAKQNSNFRRDNNTGLVNAFVAFTHAIGFKSFSFIPSDFHYDPAKKAGGQETTPDTHIPQ